MNTNLNKNNDILNDSAGFTLLELLVASFLTLICMTMVVGHVMTINKAYYDDVVRTRINSNLRSAMDIIAMNIRQSGENLSKTFPAVLLTNGTSPEADTLILRRNLIPEVLTVCLDIVPGVNNIKISSTTLSEPQCVPGNTQSLFDTFENYRVGEWDSGNGKKTRLFIYDRVNHTGEFVDYNSSSTFSDESYLNTSVISSSYSAITTSIYILEEYRFSLFKDDNTLELFINGKMDSPQAVAFSIGDFQAEIELQDGSTIYSMDSSDTNNWKDIRNIKLNLVGKEDIKSGILTSSISSSYFPRNVLSY